MPSKPGWRVESTPIGVGGDPKSGAPARFSIETATRIGRSLGYPPGKIEILPQNWPEFWLTCLCLRVKFWVLRGVGGVKFEATGADFLANIGTFWRF
jgi:hypothetical protein